jgi:tetrahydromethanopterin S-methyltransferase subunit G
MLDDNDKQWIAEKLEEVETRLLRAFRNFSHPVEARLRVQKASTRAFNERLDALEDRIEFLEEGRGDGEEPKP